MLRLILAYARRRFNVRRAIVLSREGLKYPLIRIMLQAECGDHQVGAMVDGPDLTRAGGLLADLLYAGRFRRVTPIVLDGTGPADALLEGCHSLVAFPLYDRGEAVGMVVLLGPSDRDCDAPELCGLAIMGTLLQRADRAHALTKQLETTCRSLDDELAAAASVQRWLLPRPAPPTPGVDVASFYRTAHHCGGDYYDSGTLPDGTFGILIADVSGHGAAAAVLMAILRTVVHDEVDHTRIANPAALLDHADEHFFAIGLPGRGAFITAFSGTLDIHTGRFTYSCAGHPPPRRLRIADGAVTPIDGAGSLPLGVLEDRCSHPEETVALEPGDLLLFYSDGITEARSPNGEFFGVTRLDHVLRALSQPASPGAAVQAIRDAVDTFSGPAPPTDDQTLLAVRWQPDRAAARPGGTPLHARNDQQGT
ncbi:MAG: PP2C family protein-serine/threonine phosphatase [Phycisphaerales bacterium]|nr:PP2C family protein-serine/threonine phosphatase [Phycisphaerales bacterium]